MDTHTYYDIHSHHPGNDSNTLTIQSFYSGFETAGDVPCSMGLHPWYLADAAAQLEILKRVALNPNVLAIGECGLDKVKGAPLAQQIEVFKLQVKIANLINKPLIIHCVQAHEEVLQVFKEVPPMVPVVFHGFNRKETIAQRLLEQGYYLSFGAAILNNATAAQVASVVDNNRFFLETDDAEISIQDIYKKAAALRNTDEETLILQLEHNFNVVFGL